MDSVFRFSCLAPAESGDRGDSLETRARANPDGGPRTSPHTGRQAGDTGATLARFSAADTAEFERRAAALAAALHRHQNVQGLLDTRAVRDPATGGPLVAVITARRWPDGRITVAEIAVAPEVWARGQHQFSFYLTAQVQPA
jgi:hypothetical protein